MCLHAALVPLAFVLRLIVAFWSSTLFAFLRPRSPCRGPAPVSRARHHARSLRRSRYARQGGWNLFCRLAHCSAVRPLCGFPSVQLPDVCPRRVLSECPTGAHLLRGLVPPAPPSVRGRAVASRPPPRPLLGGVFHSIARRLTKCTKIGTFAPAGLKCPLKNHK